jgi:hypothetical protein
MGFMDTVKGWFSKAPDTDQLKQQAGQAKDKADDLATQHGDKVPDSAEKLYDKASDAAEKVIPGDDPKV